MKIIWLFIISVFANHLFAQVNNQNQYRYIPLHSFLIEISPPAPDYSKKKYWLALPFVNDKADRTPKGYKNNQKRAKADVFYIHPNAYRGKFTDSLGWNTSSIEDYSTYDFNFSEYYIKMEASVFNGSCKVYAPRYRQAIKYAWEMKDSLVDSKLAIDLAYSDIREAFLFYLKNYQNDRPFFIASDDEGTYLAIRLIKEFVENKPLQKKLIAAYLIGYPVSRDSFLSISPCNSSNDFNCILSWGYFRETDTNFTKKIICHNPVSWSMENNIFVNCSKHLGLITHRFKIIKEVYETHIWDNKLCYEEVKMLFSVNAIRIKSSPWWEYQGFYMDIRANIEERVNAYFSSNW